MMVNFGCLLNLVSLIVGCLGGSVPKVDISGAAKKKRATSGFGLQGMLGVSVFVSVPCILNLSCGNISKVYYYHYSYIITITHLCWEIIDVLHIWRRFLWVAWEVQF